MNIGDIIVCRYNDVFLRAGVKYRVYRVYYFDDDSAWVSVDKYLSNGDWLPVDNKHIIFSELVFYNKMELRKRKLERLSQ